MFGVVTVLAASLLACDSGSPTALLWFLGGSALLLAGWLSEPSRPLSYVAGLLFPIVGGLTLRR